MKPQKNEWHISHATRYAKVYSLVTTLSRPAQSA